MNTATALWIIEMAGRYGVPAVRAVIENWTADNKDEITSADFEELEKRMKKPEAYFK